jgi:FtsZ-binding cell division protein ZapB
MMHDIDDIRDDEEDRQQITEAEKREQINALRQKIIDAGKDLRGDTIQVSRAEYEELRAEVASLKEERDEAKQMLAARFRVAEQLNVEVATLTQQLAAANGRVEVSALALVKAANMIESDPAVTDTIWYSMSETLWDFMIRTAQEVMNGTALSNLNEDSAG